MEPADYGFLSQPGHSRTVVYQNDFMAAPGSIASSLGRMPIEFCKVYG